MEALREAVAKARPIANAANGLEGIDRLKISVQASDIAALTNAISATTGCTGENDLLAEAAELEEILKERLAAREEAEAEEAAEKKRKDEEKAAKKAAKAKKKAEWKAKVADATDKATSTRDEAPLENLLAEAKEANVLQQRYDDDTFVSVRSYVCCILLVQFRSTILTSARLQCCKESHTLWLCICWYLDSYPGFNGRPPCKRLWIW